MSGRWVTSLGGARRRYYVNGRAVITYVTESYFFTYPTVIIKGTLIYTGPYTLNDAVAMYNAAKNAANDTEAHAAIRVYLRLRGKDETGLAARLRV